MARTGAAVETQPIDRLEDTVRQLVSLVDTLRTEKTRATDEAAGLQQQVASLEARLADGATATAEVVTLREERDTIRQRVSQMVAQIDRLNL
jgi:uncharacterized coiled-coil DUF342 family protein